MSTVADVAIAVSELLSKAVQIYEDAKQGKINPSDALGRIGPLHERLASDNAVADRILEDRFPESEVTPTPE